MEKDLGSLGVPNKAQATLGTNTVDGNNADEIQRWLVKARINVSVSRVSSTRLDMEARSLPDLVRTSVHYYNTAKEIEQFCNVLAS
jgi:selenocysteine lyase/cysteine desulfurase